MGVTCGYTPHSPRAGFASERFADGESFTSLKETGRWLADTSLRTYIDVISASTVAVKYEAAGLTPALAWCFHHIGSYFPVGCFGVSASQLGSGRATTCRQRGGR